MSSLSVVNRTRTRSMPTAWSVSLIRAFYGLAPGMFLGFAISGVIERLLTMASMLIPIKVVFLLSMSDSSTDLLLVDHIQDLGQLGLSLAVLPLGALPLIAFGLGRLVQDSRQRLAQRLHDAAPIERAQKKQLKTVTTTFSNLLGDALLAVTCITIMGILLPIPGLAILGLTVLTGISIRYRVKRIHAGHGRSERSIASSKKEAKAEPPTGRHEANLQQDVIRIARSTQAFGQALVLPVLVYMVAGALLDGETSPTAAVAFLFLFRLLSNGVQNGFSNGARAMQTFYDNPELRQWILRGSGLNQPCWRWSLGITTPTAGTEPAQDREDH